MNRGRHLVFAGLALAGVAVLVAIGLLAADAWQTAQSERELQHRIVADRVFDELEGELSTLLAREEARPFVHYQYAYVPPDQAPGSQVLSRSPLSDVPEDRFVVGYFQRDPEGQLTTPRRPIGDVPGAEPPPEAELARLEDRLTRSADPLDGWGGGPLVARAGTPTTRLVPRTVETVVAKPAPKPVVKPTPQAAGKPVEPPPQVAKAEPVEQQQFVQQRVEPQSAYGVQRALNRGASKRSDRRAKKVETWASNVDNFVNGDNSNAAVQQPVELPEPTRQEVEPTLEQTLANAEPEPVREPVEPEPPAEPETEIRKKTVWVEVPGPTEPPPLQRVEVEVSPMGAETGTDELVLHRTVRIGERRWVQGLVIDRPTFEGELAHRVVTEDLEGLVHVSWPPTAAGPSEGYRFEHRFAAPFDELAASVVVAPLPDTGTGIRVVILGGFALLLAAAAALAVAATVRTITAAARQRSDFVSAVTHELKTPLTAIQLHSEMLEQGMVPPDRQPSYYATIRSEAQRLSRLVEDVLEFSRIERGRAGRGGAGPEEDGAEAVERVLDVGEEGGLVVGGIVLLGQQDAAQDRGGAVDRGAQPRRILRLYDLGEPGRESVLGESTAAGGEPDVTHPQERRGVARGAEVVDDLLDDGAVGVGGELVLHQLGVAVERGEGPPAAIVEQVLAGESERGEGEHRRQQHPAQREQQRDPGPQAQSLPTAPHPGYAWSL